MKQKIIQTLHYAEEIFIVVLLVTMTILVFSQVVSRYIFNAGWLWSLELTTWLFAWIVLVGASWGVREKFHIGVDIITSRLNHKKQRVCNFLAICVCLVYAGIVLAGSLQYVSKLYSINIEAIDIPIPRWIPMLSLPIFSLLLIIRLSNILICFIKQQDSSLIGHHSSTISEDDENLKE